MELIKRLHLAIKRLHLADIDDLTFNFDEQLNQITLTKTLGDIEMCHPILYPPLHELFLELTGYQIRELSVITTENQLVIDLNKVNSVYQKYNFSTLTDNTTPDFITSAIQLIKTYPGYENSEWTSDYRDFTWSLIGKKSISYYEKKYLRLDYDGRCWRPDTVGEVSNFDDLLSKLDLKQEDYESWYELI